MVIADTGFWLALANHRDRYHSVAKAWLDTANDGLVTTWPVVTECCHMLLTRLGTHAQNAFVASLRQGACELFAVEPGHLHRVESLMSRYADLPMDLADASLVILAEHLGHGRILSTDERDFRTYRWKRHEPFVNLLCSGSF
jgi:predicted nucleic acid-binding protein